MNLKQTQALFTRLILEPETPEGITRFIAPGNGRLTLEERLDIYRTDYRERFVETLGDTFPNLLSIVGLDAFRALVFRFIARHPSRHYDLGLAGRALPDFLASDSLSESLPLSIDLARAEWHIFWAFQELFKPALSPQVFLQHRENNWEEACLGFQPSLKILQSSWPLPTLLRWQKEPLAEKPTALAQPLSLAIYQEASGGSTWESVDGREGRVLQALMAGLNLGEVCESILDEADSVHLQTWFSRWLERSWVTSLEF